MDCDSVQILDNLSIDEDCRVIAGMGEEVVVVEEPKKQRVNVNRKEKTCRRMVDTPQLNTMLTIYQ